MTFNAGNYDVEQY